MIGSYGRCRRCARRLKPQSIRYRNGVQYGPTCFKKITAHDQMSIYDILKAAQRNMRKIKMKELAKV
jgi:hypothetical protein